MSKKSLNKRLENIFTGLSPEQTKPQKQIRNSGLMSRAFQKDEKSWVTLRVVDETASHARVKDELMLVRQVADQLSLALEKT